MMVTIIDGKDHILGRLSSAVAERIMDGESIIVVNAQDILVTGNRDTTFADYKARVDRGQIRKGPYYPRRADLLFKRTVRGMIPFRKSSGREAFRRIHAYVGVPREFQDLEMERIETAMRLNTGKYTSLGAVAGFLGSKVR
jgi:large subunit ribosomal protein L13